MINKESKKILITGGACAGKTEALNIIKDYLTKLDYHVIILNEIPTMLITNGITPQNMGKMNFQIFVINLQIEMQKKYEEAMSFSNEQKNIILFDGSPLDALKFITKSEFEEIIEQYNLTYEDILNSYDGIMHLETVAKKYPELYTVENNVARMNNIDSAIERDNRLLDAYKSHPNRIIISSYKNLSEKKDKIIEEIINLLSK